MYNEDYLLRQFEQMAEMLAHLSGLSELVQIVQHNRRGDHAEALAAIDRTWDDLLAGPRGMARSLDTATLISLLRQPARLRVAAQLFSEEARAWDGLGDAARAAACRGRAVELIREARAADPDGGPDIDDDVVVVVSGGDRGG